jgi:uncharacterized protein YjaG (DUF416 family)
MVPLKDLIGTDQDSYADYEELAFLDHKKKWLETLRSVVFHNVVDATNDHKDAIFYTAIHVCADHAEYNHGRVGKRMIEGIVDALDYQLRTLQTCSHISRSGIEWNGIQKEKIGS